MDTLSSYGIETAMIYDSLAAAIGASLKSYEKRVFSEYLTSCVMEALTNDPDRDVTTIKADLRFQNLKPRHSK